MKKRKNGLLQRLFAVLFAAVMVTGMAWDAVPASVLAQENVGGNAAEPVEGETGQEEETETDPAGGDTKPAEGTGSDKQEEPEGTEDEETDSDKKDEEATDSMEKTDPEGQDPDGGAGQETLPPDDGNGETTPVPGTEENETESVSGNDVPMEPVAAPRRVMRAAGLSASGNVTFKYTDHTATSVYVAGDFNSWDTSSDEWKMTKNSSGEWELTKTIDSGVYAYKLVVDGTWKNDPANNTYYPNSDNSKLVVPGTVQSPVVSGDSVTFNYPVSQVADDVISVKLKGDFTGWAEKEMELSGDGSHYTITISGLSVNTYEYGINVYTESGPSYGTFCKDYYNMEAVSLGGNSKFTIQTVTTLKDGNDLIESRKPTEQLTGVYGQKLSDITFADTEWTWTDENTALSVGEQRYPAYFNTSQHENEYDFSAVEGYDSERHHVEVNLTVNVAKADTELTITTDNMDKEYDGNAVSNPDVTKTGSTSDVIFTWFKGNNDGWEALDEAPADIGSYKVVASVAEDSNYSGAETEKSFEIKDPGLSETHTHNLILTTAKSATCTEEGNKAYYVCNVNDCGKWFLDAGGTQEITDKSSVVIAALGHDWGGWTVTNPPTETTAGSKERICSRCSQLQTETIPATGGGDTPGGDDKPGGDDTPGGNKPGGSGGNSGSGDSGSGGDNSGGNPGGNGGSDGSNGGNTGSNPGTGTMASKPAASSTGQPRVKQEKEGNIRKEVSVTGESTLDVSVGTPLSRLADIVLTEEEKQQAAAGTEIKIVLDVKDVSAVVSAADRKVVETALNGSTAKGYTLGQYLDISLYKVIGESWNAVTATNGKITVTINVPDSLKNTDGAGTRTFAVLRVHDGRAELLTDLDNNRDTITIETDLFSTYAIVYKDMAGSGDGAAVRVSVKSDGGRETGGTKDGEPDTGDHTPLASGATLSMIAGLTYLLLYVTDRRWSMTEAEKKELVSRLINWAKQGGGCRTYLALAAIFVLLVYYHSIGKRICVEWRAVCGE